VVGDATEEGTPRHRVVVDVHLLLLQNGQVLLGLRQNTGFADGCWHVPAGHLAAGESLPEALAREAREELGIVVDPGSTRLVHVMHHASGRVAVFFAVKDWRGRVENREPDKCRALHWHDLERLPPCTVDYACRAIADWREGRAFSLYGWSPSNQPG
jgi:8-oxo-dGTP diphosphatase